jgi:hypothetical protein
MLNKILLVPLLLILSFVCTDLQSVQYLRVMGPDGSYSFEAPMDWMITPENLLPYYGVYENLSSESDKYNELLLIGYENVNNMDAQAYVEASLPQLEKALVGMKILSQEKTTLGGQEAVSLVFTYKTQQGLELHYTQIYTIKDDIGYVVQTVAELDKQAQYKDYFDYINKSFRFETAPAAAEEAPAPAAAEEAPAPAGQ